MANINQYESVTAVDSSDQVFVSDGGTSLKKADIAAIAKYIIENYTGSTLGSGNTSVQDAVAAVESRMDSFTSLDEGSTTGDAELVDGRTGYDGTTYANIGTAIRSQISDLRDTISDNISASDVGYNGAGSGLVATNVQAAIDEVVDSIGSQTGDSVPSSVRAALYTLLNGAAYTETGFSDEIAVIRAWAETVTGIVIDQTAITINGGTPVQLTATTTPAGGTVVWSSSDATIATVSSTGLVTGVSNGTAVISAEAGGLAARCTATVSGLVSLTGISATYTQSRTVYDTATLSDLTADLVVTATYSDSSTAVIPSTDYILSGTLEAGTSTITVSYGGKTATFNVTVTEYSTAPVIATENVVWSKDAPNTKTANGFGITQWYPYSFSQETLESSRYWDATNGYMTANGWSGFNVCVPDWNTYNAGYSWPASANFKHVTGKDNVYVHYYSITRNTLVACNFSRQSTSAVQDNCASFSIPLLDKDYSYAYWMPTNGNNIYPDGVSSGDIIFAGRYTPYYGLNNIMEAPDLSSISAVFTQGDTVVTESTTLASLKTMLEVTALYDNGKTLPVNLGLVVLSGTLTEGTSTITVTYDGKTATFNVTVTAG